MRIVGCLFVLLVGCGGTGAPAGTGGSGGQIDAAVVDAAVVDAAVDAPGGTDGSSPDASTTGYDGGTAPPGLTIYDVGAGVRAADYDEAGNLWVAGDNGTLYVKLPNETSFRSFTPANGLHAQQNGLYTLAGGVGGEVFVGYIGCDESVSPFDLNCRNYGDVDRVHLLSNGTLDVFHYEMHNTYAPQYDETRTIWRILYGHDGPARGQTFIGSQHGVARIDGTSYRDHNHAMCSNSQGTLIVSGNHAGLAFDAQGDLWWGGAWIGALWRFYADPMQWLDGDGGMYVGGAANPVERRVFLQDQPCDLTLRDDIMGIAVTSDGRAWFVSRSHGLAVWDPSRPVATVISGVTFPAPLTDIALAADGQLWVSTDGAGIVKVDPATERVTSSLGGLPSGHVTHMSATTWTGADVLVISTWRGVVTLR